MQIGRLVDETGCIEAGKLVVSNLAWEQLLGCKAEDMASKGAAALQRFEQLILFSRISLGFHWCKGMGRLVIAQIVP